MNCLFANDYVIVGFFTFQILYLDSLLTFFYLAF